MVWNLNSKPRESVSFERAPEEGYSSLGILFSCLQRPKPNYELFSRKLCSEEMHIEETGTPQRSAAGQGKNQPDVTTCRPVALCTESVQERNKSSILQLVRAVWLHRWDSMFSLMQRKSVLHIPNAWVPIWTLLGTVCMSLDKLLETPHYQTDNKSTHPSWGCEN